MNRLVSWPSGFWRGLEPPDDELTIRAEHREAVEAGGGGDALRRQAAFSFGISQRSNSLPCGSPVLELKMMRLLSGVKNGQEVGRAVVGHLV